MAIGKSILRCLKYAIYTILRTSVTGVKITLEIEIKLVLYEGTVRCMCYSKIDSIVSQVLFHAILALMVSRLITSSTAIRGNILSAHFEESRSNANIKHNPTTIVHSQSEDPRNIIICFLMSTNH